MLMRKGALYEEGLAGDKSCPPPPGLTDTADTAAVVPFLCAGIFSSLAGEGGREEYLLVFHKSVCPETLALQLLVHMLSNTFKHNTYLESRATSSRAICVSYPRVRNFMAH